MKVELKYIYQVSNGFKSVFDEPAKALQQLRADYKILHELAQQLGGNNYANCNIIGDDYIPSASIAAYIDGKHLFYELKTQITKI